jgi:hypothetical protein
MLKLKKCLPLWLKGAYSCSMQCFSSSLPVILFYEMSIDAVLHQFLVVLPPCIGYSVASPSTDI